ncbi:MAG: type II toxin-antitoxin system VapC family toxin [Chloroflexi bacterium]|nr:type II toxin-antitoxin system VapC family toxin [Chloroflexota bacterium]
MILLDTHVLLWLRLGSPRLGSRARRLLGHAWADGDAAVSTITFWEIGLLVAKGRLEVDIDVESWRFELLTDGLIEVPVRGDIAARSGVLPDMHGDPGDRIITATAITVPGCRLLTADERLLDWPGRLDRLDART